MTDVPRACAARQVVIKKYGGRSESLARDDRSQGRLTESTALVDSRGDGLVFVSSDARAGLDHGDFAAEPAKNLPHLKADVTAADDDQMARTLVIDAEAANQPPSIGATFSPRPSSVMARGGPAWPAPITATSNSMTSLRLLLLMRASNLSKAGPASSAARRAEGHLRDGRCCLIRLSGEWSFSKAKQIGRVDHRHFSQRVQLLAFARDESHVSHVFTLRLFHLVVVTRAGPERRNDRAS